MLPKLTRAEAGTMSPGFYNQISKGFGDAPLLWPPLPPVTWICPEQRYAWAIRKTVAGRLWRRHVVEARRTLKRKTFKGVNVPLEEREKSVCELRDVMDRLWMEALEQAELLVDSVPLDEVAVERLAESQRYLAAAWEIRGETASGENQGVSQQFTQGR